MNEYAKDEWTTPPRLVGWLNYDMRFNFDIDAAATKENSFFEAFWDKELNALEQDWHAPRIWCNPPYSMDRQFSEKLLETEGYVENFAMLLPVRSDQMHFQHLLHGRQIHRMWFTGRLKFGGATGSAWMYNVLFYKHRNGKVLPDHIPASFFNERGKKK